MCVRAEARGSTASGANLQPGNASSELQISELPIRTQRRGRVYQRGQNVVQTLRPYLKQQVCHKGEDQVNIHGGKEPGE